jgi:hypothetical protein
MKRPLNGLIALCILAASGFAHAKDLSLLDQLMETKKAEIKTIKALIGPKLDLAGAFALDSSKKLTLLEGDNYFKAVISSYSFGDLNGDGYRDLAVVVESPIEAPKEFPESSFGPRALRVYLGSADGSLKLFKTNSKIVLRHDEDSSVDIGDVFNAVVINQKTGTLMISHLGVRGGRWNHIQKFQFQNDNAYLIAEREVLGHKVGDTIEDTNYVKGEKTLKVVTFEGRPDTVLTSKIEKKALTKLEDASLEKED